MLLIHIFEVGMKFFFSQMRNLRGQNPKNSKNTFFLFEVGGGMQNMHYEHHAGSFAK